MTTDEIMALVGEYAESNRRWEGPDSFTYVKLRSAIEALQADAARYRWVRDPESDSPLMFSPGSYNAKYGLVDLEDMLVGASLDAAIDAAMALDKG